jgi:hypothetical protein
VPSSVDLTPKGNMNSAIRFFKLLLTPAYAW